MVPLENRRHCTSCTTLQTFHIHQPCALILNKLCLKTFAIVALDVDGEVLLVKTRNELVLDALLQDEVTFATKAAFNIKLSLNKVEYMLRLAIDLSADRLEVHP